MRALMLVFLAVAAPLGHTQETNALWNDSGAKGELGFWIYRVTGKCPEMRIKEMPLLLFSPKAKGDEHQVSGLQFCFAPDPKKPLNECKSGSVRFTLDAATRRYTGTYALVMKDGAKLEGSFEALYCPKGN